MKKCLTLIIALMLVVMSIGAQAMTAGTYEATVPGMHGPMTVQITVSEDAITDVKVLANVETPGLIDWPIAQIPAAVVENQSVEVDVVSGVSISSRAILNGVKAALELAGADADQFSTKIEKEVQGKD